MKEKRAYEHIISGKLEALPVPDMADIIWARIETRLDTDMPTDEGGDNSPQPPSGGGWIGKGSLFLFVTAFVGLFLTFKNHKNKNSLQDVRTSVPVNAGPVKRDSMMYIGPNQEQSRSLPRNRTKTGDAYPAPNTIKDSAESPPKITLSFPPADTVAGQLVTTPLNAKADTAAVKKRRGVAGIKDDDYRIDAAKKDSSR